MRIFLPLALSSVAAIGHGQVLHDSARESTAATGSYRLSGTASLQPSLIWDDGAKTYIDWPRDVEMPAVYSVDSRGEESLVNGYVRDGRLVIDATFNRLIFRLDRQVAVARRKVEAQR